MTRWPIWVKNTIHDAVLAIVVSACLAAVLLLVFEVRYLWQHS